MQSLYIAGVDVKWRNHLGKQSACLMITWGQHYQISAYTDSFTYFSNAFVTDEDIQETLNAEITMRKKQMESY